MQAPCQAARQMLAYLYDCSIPAGKQVGMLVDCAAISLSTKTRATYPSRAHYRRPSSLPRPLSAAAVGNGQGTYALCPMMTSGPFHPSG